MRRGKRHPVPVFIIVLCSAVLITVASNSTNNQQKKSGILMTDHRQQNDKAKKLAEELGRKGISDKRVLAAIAKVPRHSFIDKQLSSYAYQDRPLPIGSGQTISQPFTVAYQTELLQLKPGEKVLEVGTGSGYQAAVLCEMDAEVYSIERYYNLYQSAKETLNKLGYYPNLFFGDGFEGLSGHAPFDKILITAAPEKVPEKLLRQLRVGGWMVAPVGGRSGQKMTIIRRVSENQFKESEHGDFIFVPMQEGTVE